MPIHWRQVAHPLFFESSGMMESLANWAGDKAKGYLRVMARWTKNKRLLAMVAELDLQIEDERRNRKHLESGYSENAAYTTSRAPGAMGERANQQQQSQASGSNATAQSGAMRETLKSFRGVVKMNISFFQVLSSFHFVFDIPWCVHAPRAKRRVG
jgi:hypothetical protein